MQTELNTIVLLHQ